MAEESGGGLFFEAEVVHLVEEGLIADIEHLCRLYFLMKYLVSSGISCRLSLSGSISILIIFNR